MSGSVDHSMGICQITDFMVAHVPSGLQKSEECKQANEGMNDRNFYGRLQLISLRFLSGQKYIYSNSPKALSLYLLPQIKLKMNLDLEGRSALVCGSTQGIGRAIAEELADMGASVTLVARNLAKLQEVCAELTRERKQVHQYIQADFSNPTDLKSKMVEYLRQSRSPEILINNTGGPAGGQIIDEPYTKFMDTMTAHLECNHMLAQSLVSGMKDQKFGRIINIISTSVYVPIPGLGVSNTVRGAVASWAKTLSLELGPFGITVNNVLPGFTDTVRLEGIVKAKAQKTGMSEEEVIAAMKQETPARRFGQAHETAAAAAFLASPAAAYINGVSIPVDGGRTGCI